jgi:hypothetical protein
MRTMMSRIVSMVTSQAFRGLGHEYPSAAVGTR